MQRCLGTYVRVMEIVIHAQSLFDKEYLYYTHGQHTTVRTQLHTTVRTQLHTAVYEHELRNCNTKDDDDSPNVTGMLILKNKIGYDDDDDDDDGGYDVYDGKNFDDNYRA